ncbi:MAG: hypothetical protein ACRDRH_15710 [Pseudonocardia sp.]
MDPSYLTPSRARHRARAALQTAAQLAVLLAGGAAIGFYDGLAGPGTGSFLVFLVVVVALVLTLSVRSVVS